MITKNGENTKSETPGTRGNQEAIQPGIDSHQRRGVGQTSKGDGGESFPTNRDDRTWGNISDQRGQGIAGGIIDRLIEKVAHLIEDSEHRTAELKAQLEELRKFSTDIQKTEEPE